MAGVVAEQALANFTFRQIHDHAAEQLHDLEVIQVGQMPAGLGKEKIASQNGHATVETAVNRGHTTAGIGFINHIVVDQRSGVDHLGDLGQAPVAQAEFTGGVESPAEQQNDARPQALATGTEKVFGCRLKNGMTGANQGAQIAEELLEVRLDGL